LPLSRPPDKGKKINGRKRHIAVDTIGLLLTDHHHDPAPRPSASSRSSGRRLGSGQALSPYVIAGLGLRMMCQAEIIRW
jgi:hypothetical protein